MFIFGWGRQIRRDFGPTFKRLCDHCHNERYWNLQSISIWFTLFFIPVIPYEFNYRLYCPVCEYGFDLVDEKFEELKPLAINNKLLMDGEITLQQYNELISIAYPKNKNISVESAKELPAVTKIKNTKKDKQICSCKKCGNKINKDAKFCGRCGTPMTIKSASVDKQAPFISNKLVMDAPRQDGVWHLPPLDLLSNETTQKADRGDIKKIASKIEETLESFGIGAKVVEVNLGPAVTQYALQIPMGTKVSKITNLANDLALNTEAPTGQIRIEAPIPGRNLIGIEIPNRSLEVVTLRTMLSSDAMRKNKSKLAVSLGLDVSGYPVIADIGKMPHVLIAGTTGSGKSVLINSFIASLLFRTTPDELKLILVDPKRVELTRYNGIPHLMTPVIVEVDQILASLKWTLSEMDRRYKTFAERGVRNINSYNELAGFQALPYVVILIDEFADLMAYAPVEDAVASLTKRGSSVGIHIIISTQHPSNNVISHQLKANIPCRIAFKTTSSSESMDIINLVGAERLLSRGDMLYFPPDYAKPQRIQGAFVSEKEVKELVDFLKAKSPIHYTNRTGDKL